MSQENLTTPEEKDVRINVCGVCVFNVLDIVPKCQKSNIPLSSVIDTKLEICPEGKW